MSKPRPDRAASPTAVQDPPVRSPASPGVEQVVTLLARAIQRHHAYPAGSPLCEEAVAACQRACASLGDRESLTFRLQPGRLLLDDAPLQGAALAGAELARRLRRAGIASLTIDREVPARDLARFCREVVRRDRDAAAAAEPLAENLLQLGVEKIQVSVVHRPEVIDVGVPDAARMGLLEHERVRRADAEAVGTPIHLYPPEKGWVRVDPASTLAEASLLDLVLLVEDPSALAATLIRLSEETPPEDPAEALAEKVEEIASLIQGLNPIVAERLFTRLARSVLDLPPDRRQHLLRDALLPGLFEGRADGSLLRHFPDVELADALALLLDLQVAAPEMLATALDRLQLPDERRERLQPLLDERVARRRAAAAEDAEALRPGAIDGLADGHIRVDHRDGKDFREFVAHDLAIDEATRAQLQTIAGEVRATDPLETRTRCVHHVLLVETNPETALALSELAGRLLADWRDRADLAALTRWVTAFRANAASAAEERPDLSQALRDQLARLPTPGLVRELAALAQQQPKQTLHAELLEAFGDLIGPATIAALGEADDAGRRAVVRLLASQAETLAPTLAGALDTAPPQVARYLLQAIGPAAAGLETRIAPFTTHPDEHLAREAFRALARAATPAAVTSIVSVLAAGGPRVILAEEAFWRLPAPTARAEARRLLADRAFAARQPVVARAVLGRLADQSPGDAAAVARQLTTMRFHIWRPARVRLGMAARAIAGRAA